MSIAFNIFAPQFKPISRSEIAAKLRDLHWAVLMRDNAGRYVRPQGMLADGDRFYGADSRRVAESELRYSLENARLDAIHATSGGEAIVCIKSDFDISKDGNEDVVAELATSNPAVVKRLKEATVHIAVNGGSYFALQLSEAIARLENGMWEDPQTGDREIM